MVPAQKCRIGDAGVEELPISARYRHGNGVPFSIVRFVTAEPPIAGVRRYFVEARWRAVSRDRVGPADGRPVVAHTAGRNTTGCIGICWRTRRTGCARRARPSGYGWSRPAPHKWAREDVASDVLALLDALGLDRVLLVGHNWGGFVGHLMVLRSPRQFEAISC